jgi:RNA-binding protein NOB1
VVKAAVKAATGSWAAIASKPVPKAAPKSSRSPAVKNSRVKEEVIAASAVACTGNSSGTDYFMGTSQLAQAAILAASEDSTTATSTATSEGAPLKATSRILTAGVSSTGNMDRGEDIAAEDDGEGWVNESNVNAMATAAWGKGGKSVHASKEDDIAAAGCITTDFAMQNVILQIGLKLLAVDGRTIRRLKQWVYKCDACFFISAKNLGTTFCPRCGSNAMKRLSVRVGADGAVQYGYNPYRRISTRGQRYAIAKRKGGRGGQGLVLRADQVKMGTWNVKAKEKQKLRSQFGEDITGSLGLDLQKAGGDLQAGFGRRNPNKMRGRERRGKKGLRKKKGKRFNPYRTDNTA